MEWIDGDKMWTYFSFIDCGPTTYNVVSFLIPCEDRVFLTYEFWRPDHIDEVEVGVVNSVEVELGDLVETLSNTITSLQ